MLLICTWILASLIKKISSQDVCSLKYNEILCANISSTTTQQPPSFEDEVVVISNDDIKRSRSEVWVEFYEIGPVFQKVVLVCLSGVIFGAAVQLLCSSILVFTPSYVSRVSDIFPNLFKVVKL